MKFIVMVGLLVWGGVATLAADEADKAIGYWKSISDVKGEEGKMTAIWKLTVTNGVLEGAIVYVPDESPTKLYTSKKKEFNGKPVSGTKWMTGLKKTGKDSWGGGQIVDVGDEKGDVYGCEIKVTSGGKKLDMRGFIGFAFIGRTQVWETISEAEVLELLAE